MIEQERTEPEAETDWEPMQPLTPAGRHRPIRWLLRWTVYVFDRLFGLLLTPFTNRKMQVGTVAALVGVLIWTVGLSGPGTESAFAKVSRPLSDRAAFNWEAQLSGALADWTDPSAFQPVEPGVVRVRGLTLHRKTVTFANYEMSFVAQVNGRAIGWVIRAADTENYYVFKLIPRGSRSGPKWQFDLARYLVLRGRAPAGSTVNTVPLTIEVPESKQVLISVRVTDEQVYTLINDYGVDTWKHPQNYFHKPQLKTGGLGFVAEPGDSFLVRSLTVSGNEDLLGRLLWGARETYLSLRSKLAS